MWYLVASAIQCTMRGTWHVIASWTVVKRRFFSPVIFLFCSWCRKDTMEKLWISIFISVYLIIVSYYVVFSHSYLCVIIILILHLNRDIYSDEDDGWDLTPSEEEEMFQLQPFSRWFCAVMYLLTHTYLYITAYDEFIQICLNMHM